MRPETLLLALFAAGAGLLLLINAGNLGAARKSAPAVTHVVYTSDVGPPGGMPADDTPEAMLGLPESELASTAPLSAASPPPPPLYARAAVAIASVPPLLLVANFAALGADDTRTLPPVLFLAFLEARPCFDMLPPFSHQPTAAETTSKST